MADRAIQVAVLEGYFASLSALGFPMPLSLQLQQSHLRLDAAMWTAKSSKAGFSVSFFWPVANQDVSEVKCLKKKRRRRNKRKAKAINNVEISSGQVKSDNLVLGSLSTPIDANHDDDGPDKSQDSVGRSSTEPEPINLMECTDVVYEKKNDTHGVKYVCGEDSEGWTSVIGKRRKYRVPTRLLRLRAPPHVRANLPSTSDASDSDTSGSDCSLHIPANANVQYSLRHGKPGLQVTTSSTSTWTPVSSRTRSKLK